MPKLGPYSRPDAFRNLDGRTWEAKLLASTRAELTAHVGGAPSATQRALIDRAAWLTLYLAQMDRRSADLGAMTDHDSRSYLAWSNTLARTLARLGPQAKAAKPDLASYVASRASQVAV
jgi:hypothetical protein